MDVDVIYMSMGTGRQPLQYFHLYTKIGTRIHKHIENAKRNDTPYKSSATPRFSLLRPLSHFLSPTCQSGG